MCCCKVFCVIPFSVFLHSQREILKTSQGEQSCSLGSSWLVRFSNWFNPNFFSFLIHVPSQFPPLPHREFFPLEFVRCMLAIKPFTSHWGSKITRCCLQIIYIFSLISSLFPNGNPSTNRSSVGNKTIWKVELQCLLSVSSGLVVYQK